MPNFKNFDPDTYEYRLTNADICVRTHNSLRDRILKQATSEEAEDLNTLATALAEHEEKMDAKNNAQGYYDREEQQVYAQLQIKHDKFLGKLQAKYRVSAPTSRTQAILTPRDGMGLVPFGFANMNRVTGRRMGEAAARRGGWATFPQGKSEKQTADFVNYVQSRHPRFLTPVSGTPNTPIRDALYYLQKRPVGNIVMTDERGRMLRILHEAKLKEYEKIDEEMEIGRIPLSPEEERIVQGFDDMSTEETLSIMRAAHIQFLPITQRVRKSRQKLLWVITRKEAEIQPEFPAYLDGNEKLATSVAVSMFREGWDKRVQQLIDMNVTIIMLDSPHAYQGLDGLSAEGEEEATKEEFRPRVLKAAQMISVSKKPIHLIVGNVDDPEAVRSIIAAAIEGGMDPKMVTVKVGIGPGHACITREEAGIGMPQWSTVYECAKVARRMGANVQADGGVALPADIEKYIAAGASHVLIGTKGVPLVESPAILKTDENGVYGVNYGMGSDMAYALRDDVPQGPTTAKFNEGLRDQRVYQTPGIVDVSDFTARYGRGIKSFALFNGARTLEEAYDFSTVSLQHASGFSEGLGKKTVK